MARPSRYSPEVRERAGVDDSVVAGADAEHPSGTLNRHGAARPRGRREPVDHDALNLPLASSAPTATSVLVVLRLSATGSKSARCVMIVVPLDWPLVPFMQISDRTAGNH